jgi:hypothetical protein
MIIRFHFSSLVSPIMPCRMMRSIDSDNFTEDLIHKQINKRVERHASSSLNKAALVRIPLGSDTHSNLTLIADFGKHLVVTIHSC